MQRGPFGQHPERAGRQPATDDGERADVDQDLLLAVLRVQVRRVMVVVEDLDHDAIEATDFRHSGGPVP